MRLPIRALMASEVFGYSEDDERADYVYALVDADDKAICHTGDFHDILKDDADLIVAAVNAYKEPAP